MKEKDALQTRRTGKGLCPACYGMAIKLVKEGKATWLALEAAGKVRPSKRSRQDATRRWLTELVKGAK